MQQSALKVLHALASLRITPLALVALVAGTVVMTRLPTAHVAWMLAPLAVLSVNLLAAIFTHPRLYRHSALLVFHLSLLALLVLIGYGRLSAFQGHIEMVDGQAFNADDVEVVQAGPLHRHADLAALAFEQHGVRIAYHPHLVRDRTTSQVKVAGQRETFSFGDSQPLHLKAYRFYTTSNKGYAVIVSWLDDKRGAQTGAIHLPSFPLRDWDQHRQWRTPQGSLVNFALRPAATVDDAAPWQLDSDHCDGVLTVTTADGTAAIMTPGATLRLPGGTLRYEGLRLWMGYKIDRDASLTLLFAVAMTGALALAWFMRDRLHEAAPLEQQATTGEDRAHA